MTSMLEYKVRQSGDVTVLDLSGRISVGEALAFGPGSGVVLADVIGELTKRGKRKILLNLKAVKYIDSSGIGELVRNFTSLRRQGGELKLLSPTAAVLEALRITHLDRILDIKEDEQLAVHSFSKPISMAG
jgi:anti-sigma B factor antagonist